MTGVRDSASYRDPSGHVWLVDGRVLRTVSRAGAAEYEFVRDSGLLERWVADGRVVESKEVDPAPLGEAAREAAFVLEHPRLPFISYPYEWSFRQLRAAALLQLDLHLEALHHGVSLSDASAYNVQFRGGRPVFIDVLSFRRYREGEPWVAHRQFCEQFLNPLLLRARLGVAHNAWLRGRLEGVPTADLSRLLGWRHWLSPGIVAHVFLQARLQARAADVSEARLEWVRNRRLPLRALEGLLSQVRGLVARLRPADRGRTVWSGYAQAHTYAEPEHAAKRAFVADFVRQIRPTLLWDLGCNTGEYSALALAEGARHVVGFDSDLGAIEAAAERAEREGLDFTPLLMDFADPSPDRGWAQLERKGLASRAEADALVALALIHHLAIGRNVPLPEVLRWLVTLAPQGIIEFVRKDDPTVQRMLALRDDIFADYDQEAFERALRGEARIAREIEVSSTGRRLYWYDRR